MDTAKFPYSYSFNCDHPRRMDHDSSRWTWLCENIGIFYRDWDWHVPFENDEDLVFYFRSKSDLALFVLTWA